MENKHAHQIDNDLPKSGEAALPSERQPYHAPKLIYHGELVELVQNRDGIGADAGQSVDCTKT